MPEPLSPQALISELASLPNARELSFVVRDRALYAARARETSFLAPGRVEAGRTAAETSGFPSIARERAETSFGNISDMLERGVEAPESLATVSTLLALGVAQTPEDLEDARSLTVPQLVWLATNTGCNPFGALESLIDERRAAELYRLLAELVVGSLRP